jgi:hypothetical protein
MMAATFDTLHYARVLEDAGVPRLQAEALVQVVSQAQEINLQSAATKADIETLRISTKADIDALRIASKTDIDALRISSKADLTTGLAETKADLIKWVVGVGFAQVAMILAVLKLHS